MTKYLFIFTKTDKEEVGSVGQVEMLHRTNLIAIVGKLFKKTRAHWTVWDP